MPPSQFDIAWEDLRALPVVHPDINTQVNISDFLDRETAEADALIAKYERLLELLEEKRVALITQVVTKGLDPNVPIKDSGVEWIGKIPAHWKIGPLKRFCRVVDCKHVTVDFWDEGIPVASVREVQEFDLNLDSANRTSTESYSEMVEGGRRPQRGDIIYCRNVSVGAAAYVNTDEAFAMGQDVCLIRSNIDGRFLNYVLHSSMMRDQLNMVCIGATFNRINVATIRELVIPWPSSDEQTRIAHYLDQQCSMLNELKNAVKRAKVLARERRSALITAAVTGQIDVTTYKSGTTMEVS